MGERLYFSYGSNINLDQMAHRCPNAQVVGPVVLKDYELLFRGNVRGNGVATIKPQKGQKVQGLLWKITPACERALDLYEGWPRLYGKEDVTVHDSSGQEFTVMVYVMTDQYKEPALPSVYYYGGIEAGYRQNGLPVSALAEAWDNCVKEVHARTKEINTSAVDIAKPPKRRNHHER